MDTFRQLTDRIGSDGYAFMRAASMRILLEQVGALTDWPAARVREIQRADGGER